MSAFDTTIVPTFFYFASFLYLKKKINFIEAGMLTAQLTGFFVRFTVFYRTIAGLLR